MLGSSAAVALSGIPFEGPIGAVRVALVDGRLIANPTYKQIEASPLELVIAGTEDAILMVESGGREIGEEQMLEALAFGQEQCRRLARIQKVLVAEVGKARWPFDAQAGADAALEARIRDLATEKIVQALSIHDKQGRAHALETIFEEVWAAIGGDETATVNA